MASRRFTRLTNGFSKRADFTLPPSRSTAHYSFCRVREALRITPAMALRLRDHIWTIGELLEASLEEGAAKTAQNASAAQGDGRQSKGLKGKSTKRRKGHVGGLNNRQIHPANVTTRNG
jgi:hypothetical protein